MHHNRSIERFDRVDTVAQLTKLTVAPCAHFLLDAHAHADALDPPAAVLLVCRAQSPRALQRSHIEGKNLVFEFNVTDKCYVTNVDFLVTALRVCERGEVVKLAVLENEPPKVHAALVVPPLFQVALNHALRELFNQKELIMEVLFHITRLCLAV